MAFRSGLEEQVADLLVSLDVKYEYESTKVPYIIQHNYTPDFLLPNGIYLECKGYWDSEDRRKTLAVLKSNPDIDLRMVFQAPYNKISKKSKTTYATWCDKHDIKWCAFHSIPIEWLT
ncbi:MAG: hypothetical protein GWN86_10310 [Desulfobacterales bacterium]|nr:hypothetical protein [Desulfobacterales bacterium]